MARSPQSDQSGKNVAALLARPGASLSELVKHAEALLQLETLLKRSVAAPLKDQFQVAAVRKNRLILISPSASLATRLKLLSHQMLEHLRANDIKSIDYIDLRVAPLTRKSIAKPRKRSLTPAASKALEAISAVLKKPPADPDDGC